ncbi:MAG TPA: hypothetical protein VGR57_18360 [Ktedonobacterales bacterium]|nr:hypothetical protein [Ktedonobacterales bacterium]
MGIWTPIAVVLFVLAAVITRWRRFRRQLRRGIYLGMLGRLAAFLLPLTFRWGRTLVYSDAAVLPAAAGSWARCQMPIGRTLYWLLTGALIGVGVISDPAIGTYLLVFGVTLAVAGAVGLMSRGGAAACTGLIVLGGLPAALLEWIFGRSPWACAPPPRAGYLPNIEYAQCTDTIFGALPVYDLWVAGFGIIAVAGVAGLAWSLLGRLRSLPHGASA